MCRVSTLEQNYITVTFLQESSGQNLLATGKTWPGIYMALNFRDMFSWANICADYNNFGQGTITTFPNGASSNHMLERNF